MRRLVRWMKKDTRALALLVTICGLLLPVGALVLAHFDLIWIDYMAPLLVVAILLSIPFAIGWLISAAPVRTAASRVRSFVKRHRAVTAAILSVPVFAFGILVGRVLVIMETNFALKWTPSFVILVIIGFIILGGSIAKLIRDRRRLSRKCQLQRLAASNSDNP